MTSKRDKLHLPGLNDRDQIEALFLYVLMLLAVFLGLALVGVTAAGLDGGAVIGTFAGLCVTGGVTILTVRAGRRNGHGDD